MVVRWQILSLMTNVIEVTSPMGEPSKVALAGSSTWAPGIADRIFIILYYTQVVHMQKAG